MVTPPEPAMTADWFPPDPVVAGPATAMLVITVAPGPAGGWQTSNTKIEMSVAALESFAHQRISWMSAPEGSCTGASMKGSVPKGLMFTQQPSTPPVYCHTAAGVF